ncbi:hypothetical protein RAA17_09405 [Komagataeibacter rhaeticus]|nr:hypothetical protein [Komagataeibacter rhaeticus]
MPSYPLTPVLIAGGGPAGIALLLAASRMGELSRLLDEGITLVEQGHTIGSGMLGRYVINSDSAAETFVDALTDNPVLRTGPTAHPPAGGDDPGPWQGHPAPAGGGGLSGSGGACPDRTDPEPSGLPASDRLAAGKPASGRQGEWAAHLVSADGARAQHVRAAKVVLALGAIQPECRLHDEQVGGAALLPRYSGRLMQSDDLLAPDGISRLRTLVAGSEKPKIAIIGGASSALSVARVILRDMGNRIVPGNLTLLHRSRLKLFYRTAEEALADGYTDFGAADICPISHFVYRFGGCAMIHAIWPCS